MITFQVQAAPLPADFKYTPQQLLEAFVDRLEITSDSATFVISDVEPTGNQGPWFKNGKQLWVYDTDEAAYVPLDISNSYNPQILVSETAPADPTKTPMWLKITGDVVDGLYYYSGVTDGWVTQDVSIHDGSITTAMLADSAITTVKVADLAITTDKLANDISMTKWAQGLAKQFIRMNDIATTPEWVTLLYASNEIAVAFNTVLEWTHSLGGVPHDVQAVWVCKESDLGYSVGDEIDVSGGWSYIFGPSPDFEVALCSAFLYKTSTKAGISIGNGLHLVNKGSAYLSLSDDLKWRLKFYAVAP